MEVKSPFSRSAPLARRRAKPLPVTNFTSTGVSGEPRRTPGARYRAMAPPDS